MTNNLNAWGYVFYVYICFCLFFALACKAGEGGGVYFLSPINNTTYLSRRRMCWEEQQDCFNPLMATNVRRDTVDFFMKSLHFTNNEQMRDDETDVYYKVCFFL